MDNLIALVVATLVLVMIPGPNAALIVANSVRDGLRAGAITVLGTTMGVAVQLLLVVLGMAAIIQIAADALTWIRWAGVAYLVWLGIRTWRQAPADLSAIKARPAVFWRAFVVAAVNPKTLLFNAAFLPQFVPTQGDTTSQLAIVSAVFLVVLLLGDMLWALLADTAAGLLRKKTVARNRITGGFLVLAGIGLALSRRAD